MRSFRGVFGAVTKKGAVPVGAYSDDLSMADVEKVVYKYETPPSASTAPTLATFANSAAAYMPQEVPMAPAAESGGMSTGMIVGIAVAGVALIGGAIYLARR